MINPSIETDLVGELIEVHEPVHGTVTDSSRLLARGRCRAVTYDNRGSLILWLEVVAWPNPLYCHHMDAPQIGDVYLVHTDYGNGPCFLRLVKQ